MASKRQARKPSIVVPKGSRVVIIMSSRRVSGWSRSGPKAGGFQVSADPHSRSLYAPTGMQRPRSLPKLVVLVSADGTRTTWTVIPPSGAVRDAGWQHRHACGHVLYQWAGPQRPESVKCLKCGGWTVAP